MGLGYNYSPFRIFDARELELCLRRGDLRSTPVPLSAAPLGPGARSERDAHAAGGVGIQRHTDRALARLGHLTEAAPQSVVAVEAVRYGGASCRRCWRCRRC